MAAIVVDVDVAAAVVDIVVTVVGVDVDIAAAVVVDVVVIVPGTHHPLIHWTCMRDSFVSSSTSIDRAVSLASQWIFSIIEEMRIVLQ